MPLAGFSITIRVGGKTSGVGGESTTGAEGMTSGWGCMGVWPTWKMQQQLQECLMLTLLLII